MTNRLSNAASEIYNAVVGTLSGLQSNVQGLLLIATSPALGWKCFRHTPEALVGVAVSYGFVWLFCWPMQWLGLLEVSWNEILRIASIPALLILRVVLPIASEEVFFAVIKSRDECLESSLHGLPRLRGLKDTLIFWAKLAAGGISAIGLITASAPLIMPPLIAAVTSAGVAIFALGPLVIAVGCATVVVLAVLVGAGAMVFDKFLQPLVSIWRFDPILCVVVLICVMFGGFKLSAIGQGVAYAVRAAIGKRGVESLSAASLLAHPRFWLADLGVNKIAPCSRGLALAGLSWSCW
eukprot:TRINITY_DN12978_c1_g1_i2.p1 TRINITY_DN12978_c1_g1~~TRINITY_DN12978_c1_g1_i2.p1  ORF type:complete len:295 (-),score=23.69 TRINITY_DN12978_c1_g1_i2:104-988(-)